MIIRHVWEGKNIDYGGNNFGFNQESAAKSCTRSKIQLFPIWVWLASKESKGQSCKLMHMMIKTLYSCCEK